MLNSLRITISVLLILWIVRNLNIGELPRFEKALLGTNLKNAFLYNKLFEGFFWGGFSRIRPRLHIDLRVGRQFEVPVEVRSSDVLDCYYYHARFYVCLDRQATEIPDVGLQVFH